MKRKPLYILIVIAFFLLLHFYLKIPEPSARAKCPDDFKTSEDQMTAMNDWTNSFYDLHSGATLSDWSKARYTFWVTNHCVEALKRYNEAKNGKADPATMNLIKDAIINNN